MLKVKMATSKPKIGNKETITSVISRISQMMNNGKSRDAKRLFTLAKDKWKKKFTQFYASVTSKNLTKKDAKQALEKKRKANKKNKRSKYAKKNTTFQEGEVFTPVWDVWISGTKLNWDKKNLISTLQITETVDGSDTATLQIVDPNFEFIEDNIFKEDNKITIKMGWSAYTYRCTFKGYISAVDIQFTSEGIPNLTISCMDDTYRMYRKEKSKTWKKSTSAAIVKKICKEYGFKCKVEKGYKFKTQKTVTQSNQTDIEFIQSLAQNETRPFTARLVGDTFHYEKKGDMKKTADFILHYMEPPADVISFSPKINKISKTEVKAATTDKKTKTAESATSTATTHEGSASSGKKSDNSSKDESNTSGGVRRDPVGREWTKE